MKAAYHRPPAKAMEMQSTLTPKTDMAKQGISKGRVTVTAEIDADGVWGFDCKLDQFYKQASAMRVPIGDKAENEAHSYRNRKIRYHPT